MGLGRHFILILVLFIYLILMRSVQLYEHDMTDDWFDFAFVGLINNEI